MLHRLVMTVAPEAIDDLPDRLRLVLRGDAWAGYVSIVTAEGIHMVAARRK